MNIKKAVVDRVITLLNDELKLCNGKLQTNKYQFKRLAEEQTILKRERAKLTEIINSLRST